MPSPRLQLTSLCDVMAFRVSEKRPSNKASRYGREVIEDSFSAAHVGPGFFRGPPNHFPYDSGWFTRKNPVYVQLSFCCPGALSIFFASYKVIVWPIQTQPIIMGIITQKLP